MTIQRNPTTAHAPPHLPLDVLRLIADELLSGITAPYEPRPASDLLRPALVCKAWSSAFLGVLQNNVALAGDLDIGFWLAGAKRTPPRLVQIVHLRNRSQVSVHGLRSLFARCQGVEELGFGGAVNFDFNPEVFSSPGLADLKSMTMPSTLFLPPSSAPPIFAFHLRHLHLATIRQRTLLYLPSIITSSKDTLVSFRYGSTWEGSEPGLAQALAPVQATLEAFHSENFLPHQPALGNFLRGCSHLRRFTCRAPSVGLPVALPSTLTTLVVTESAYRVSLTLLSQAIQATPRLRLLLLYAPETDHPDRLSVRKGGPELLALCKERGTTVYIQGADHRT
ncbi:hypothetical protein JCM6882_005270 [Rhodosporidiobolus microsporus]